MKYRNNNLNKPPEIHPGSFMHPNFTDKKYLVPIGALKSSPLKLDHPTNCTVNQIIYHNVSKVNPFSVYVLLQKHNVCTTKYKWKNMIKLNF